MLLMLGKKRLQLVGALSLSWVCCVCTSRFPLTGESFFELGGRGHVHGALAVAVEQGRVGAVAQQQGTHLHPVLGCRFVERSELPQVHRIHTGSVLQRDAQQILRRDCKYFSIHQDHQRTAANNVSVVDMFHRDEPGFN